MKPALHRTIQYIYLISFGIFIFLLIIIFTPPGCMPGVHWSKNLYLSRFDCSRSSICTMKPNSCMHEHGGYLINFLKDFDKNAKEVRKIQACYNKDGFRDYNHPVKRPYPYIIRIEMIGSSQTYGLGLRSEDSIPALLENILNHRAMEMGLPFQFEVFNFCLPCIYLPSMFRIYTDFGRKYKPDLTIYEYCEPGRLHSLDIEGRIRQAKHIRLYAYLMKSDFGKVLLNRIFMFEHIILNSLAMVRGAPENTIDAFRQTCKIAQKDHTFTAFFEYWNISKGLDSVIHGYKPWVFASGVNRTEFKIMSYDNGNHPDESGSLYYAMILADRILSSSDPVFNLDRQ